MKYMAGKVKMNISDRMGEINTLTNFETLITFLKQEIGFWAEVNSELTELKKLSGFQEANCHKKFASWASNLEKLIQENGEADHTDQEIQNAINDINKRQWLSSTRDYTRAYIDCYKKFGKEPANTFLTIVSTANNARAVAINPKNSHEMLAILSAYEYLSKDGSFASRQNSELSALKQLYKNYHSGKNELDEKVISITKYHQEDLTNKNKAFEDLCADISEKNKKITTDHDESFTKLYKQSTGKMAELENTYENKLTLSAPVLYWKRAAKKNGCLGLFWGILLGVIVFSGIGLFSGFFYKWLGSHDMPVKLSSIQGIVVFGVILALFTVAIRMVSKMMLSSLHSKHDAEERVNLVYLYLALKHKNKIDDKHSEIVLQALFSRSDSGLLSKDTGIVMPTVHDVIKASN